MGDREFSDEEARDLWERLLTTRSEAAFRDFVFDRIDLRPDDAVLSVGCGPGFETAALEGRLGEDGSVTGVDANRAVLAAAIDRRDDSSTVSFVQGDAADLPVADESYDVAVAKQVLPTISDVEPALRELRRAVKLGGRVAVTAGDRRAHVKHTPTDRMRRADEIYRAEMGNRRLGTRLTSLLPAVGFPIEAVVPRAECHTEINDQVERGIEVQRGLLASNDGFDDAEIEAWERDLRDLAEDEQFLACSTAFLYVARKPD